MYSQRKYADHRKALGLPGGTAKAVRKAIEAKRLEDSIVWIEGVAQIADLQRADLEWRNKTDPGRYTAAQLAKSLEIEALKPARPAAAPADVVVYEGPGGVCSISLEMHVALGHALANPDQPLLTAAMAATLDQILKVRGLLAPDFVPSPIPSESAQ